MNKLNAGEQRFVPLAEALHADIVLLDEKALVAWLLIVACE
jgi:hypothetical protein